MLSGLGKGIEQKGVIESVESFRVPAVSKGAHLEPHPLLNPGPGFRTKRCVGSASSFRTYALHSMVRSQAVTRYAAENENKTFVTWMFQGIHYSVTNQNVSSLDELCMLAKFRSFYLASSFLVRLYR